MKNRSRQFLALLPLALLLISCGNGIPDGYVEVKLGLGGQAGHFTLTDWLADTLQLHPFASSACVPTQLIFAAFGENPNFFIRKDVTTALDLNVTGGGAATKPFGVSFIIPKGAARQFQLAGYFQDSASCVGLGGVTYAIGGMTPPIDIVSSLNIGIDAWVAPSYVGITPSGTPGPYVHARTFTDVRILALTAIQLGGIPYRFEVRDFGFDLLLGSITTISPGSPYLISGLLPNRVYEIHYYTIASADLGTRCIFVRPNGLSADATINFAQVPCPPNR